ncbi:MAG: aminomethyl transferase family protein [Deltaproteobacteria bacterium]|nr:aminomethyl transferase family protein [Deltaproteobacteria bacterium]
MPRHSPFHSRIAPLCESFRYKDWGGYVSVASFKVTHEREYNAFRQTVGVIDVTPLFKYEIRGKDAERFLGFVTVKDVSKLKVGRVTYTCWCTEDGKVVDDGTLTHLAEDLFLLTAAEPSYWWLHRFVRGFDVELSDVTENTAALAIQGPLSRDALQEVVDLDMDSVRFFSSHETTMHLAGAEKATVRISRTGYTGDLGYELWCQAEKAEAVWDRLFEAGFPFGIEPCGIDALDVTRVEAGFIMCGIDYFSAPTQIISSRKSTPFELGLEWTLNLERGPFVGKHALLEEKARGSEWQMVGLEMDWVALEALYSEYGLPPYLGAAASRQALPVFFDGTQIGQMTSSTWSPILKKYIGLASIRTSYASESANLFVEHTPDFERRLVPCRVRKLPFFDPPRKRKP